MWVAALKEPITDASDKAAQSAAPQTAPATSLWNFDGLWDLSLSVK